MSPKKRLPATAVPRAYRSDIESWLASSEIDAAALVDHLKASLILVDQYEATKDRLLAERAELGELSWLGGPALGDGEWPRNADGEPLAHIATILLPEAAEVLASGEPAMAWPEPGPRLPDTGYLEVFHHLGTYGNPEDAGSGGWLVRHVPFDGETFLPLVDAPADLNLPHEVCQPVFLVRGFSVPAAADAIEASDREFAAAEKVEEETNAAWTALRRGADSVPDEPVFQPSRMYGHSDVGDAGALEILNEALPLADDADAYVLLLSVESWTSFNGWFGDAGTFEVWMRGSDLVARRFDAAWCMIRTD